MNEERLKPIGSYNPYKPEIPGGPIHPEGNCDWDHWIFAERPSVCYWCGKSLNFYNSLSNDLARKFLYALCPECGDVDSKDRNALSREYHYYPLVNSVEIELFLLKLKEYYQEKENDRNHQH